MKSKRKEDKFCEIKVERTKRKTWWKLL